MRLILIGLVCLLLAGCRSAPTPAGQTPRRTAPISTPAGTDISVGLPDNGRTVVAHVGQRIVVTLAAQWTPPQAAGSAVRLVSATGYPAPVLATASLLAVAAGRASISASTDYACLHA